MEERLKKIFSKSFLFSSLLLILFLYFFPFYTQDGPNHKQVALILSRLAQSPLESEVYQSNLGFFQTNSLFPLLYQPLSQFISIDTYEKIFVGFFLILLSLAYRIFLWVWNKRNLDFWMMVLFLWIHPLLWMGFYNFIAGTALSILALSLLKKGVEERKIVFFPIYLMIVWISFLAHPFPSLFLILILFISSLVERGKHLSWYFLYTIPPLALSIFGFFNSFIKAESEGVQTPIRFMQTIEQIGGLLFKNFILYSTFQTIISLIPFILIIFLMIYSLKKVAWRLKIFWIICLLGFFYSPSEMGGGAYLNDRFLPYLFIFLPLGIEFGATQIKKIKIIMLTALVLLTFGTMDGLFRIDSIAKEYREALNKLPSSVRLYPISFDTQSPAYNYHPLHHFWALFDHEKVVFSPYLFAWRELNPLSKKIKSAPNYFPATYDSYPSEVARNLECKLHDAGEVIDCETVRKKGFERIFKNAAYYDYWLIYSPPEDFIQQLENEKGLSKITESGKVSLWHYENGKEFEK